MSHDGFSSQEDDDDDDETESEIGVGGWSTSLAATTSSGIQKETYTSLTRIRLSGGADMKRTSRDSVDSTVDGEIDYEGDTESARKIRKYKRLLKITILLICWMIFSLLLMLNAAMEEHPHMVCVPADGTIDFVVTNARLGNVLEVIIDGPFKLHIADTLKPMKTSASGGEVGKMTVVVQLATLDADGKRIETKPISQMWLIDLHNTLLFDTAPVLRRDNTFQFTEKFKPAKDKQLLLTFSSDIDQPIPLELNLQETPMPEPMNYITAMLLVCGMYVLIVFNIVHRTLASLLTCSFALSILAAFNEMPKLTTIIEWIDIELLMEIFGMSVIVSMLAKTGILEQLAAKAYEWANGHIWPMLNLMIVIVTLATLIFDNIAIMILMSPIMIRLSEIMMLNPVPVLMCLIIMTNIVSAWTPIGDPPNMVIRNNYYVTTDGEISVETFIAHLAPGMLLVMVQAYIHLRIQYYSSKKMRFTARSEIERLQRVIKVWRKTATGMTNYTKNEKTARDTVDMKVRRLRKRMRRLGKMPKPPEDFGDTLEMLKANNPIKDKVLLYQCCVVLLFVILIYIGTVMYSLGITINLPPGWIALLAAMLLLIIVDCEMEAVLVNIEWATLLFLATLFVLIESMDKMDLTDAIGRTTEYLISSAKSESRLMVAMSLILWTSAIASAFLVNLPVTSMMLGIVISLSKNPDLSLPLQPLIWALALGVCMGGNGSLIGAVSNIVCAGIAEKHGYKFRFMDFFKIGFPVMIGSLIVSTLYLWMAHVVFHWH